jgi:hypothetical protein
MMGYCRTGKHKPDWREEGEGATRMQIYVCQAIRKPEKVWRTVVLRYVG